MNVENLTLLDRVIQAALVLRRCESRFAKDSLRDIVDRTDPDGRKLDAYTLGLLGVLPEDDAVTTPSLLTYVLLLREMGPGAATVEAAERMRSLAGRPELDTYVALGHNHMRRVLDGERPEPGDYANLLISGPAAERTTAR